MKIRSILPLACCAMATFAVSAFDFPAHQEYSRHMFVDSTGFEMPYRMLEPDTLRDGARYPLVLFLHGSGERGDDNESQLTHGASLFSDPVNMEKYPAFVLFPQCDESAWTGRIDESFFMPGAKTPPESRSERNLMELIDTIASQNPVDTSRIYIIGISMGGIAAYDLACRHPEKFAAVVPICGAINPERLPEASKSRFLIFHGADDDEIPAICGREAYRALRKAGAQVDYIEFPGIGHECWNNAFNHPDFLPFL